MHPIELTIVKQTYRMDDGNLISGIQVIVAPMIYKFISFSKQKLDLIAEIRPDLYQWFINSPDGSTLILREPVSSPSLPYSVDNNPNQL